MRHTIRIPLALLINLALGLGFAWCGRERIRADGPFASPSFTLVACFAGVIVGPVALYFHLVHPAWTWMYLVDPKSVPALSIVPVTLGQVGAVFAGWYVGGLLLRTGKQRALAVAAGVISSLALVAFVVGSSRLGQYGSFDEFSGGRTLDLMQVKLGYVLVAITLGGGAATIYVAIELLRDSRRVRARN